MAAANKPPARQAPPAVSTAGRLKYADPRSLPSFPSSGLAPDGAAASAAATLGWSNQKTVDLWKPDRTASASAAAALATEYKMSPLWEPTANPDGQKAALLAVGSAGTALKRSNAKSSLSPSQDSWGNSAATQAFHASRPASAEPTNLSHGSSAATQAFNMRRSSLSVKRIDPPITSPGHKSLVAAKGAMSASIGVKDAHTAEVSAATSALDGATKAHRASMQAKPPVDEAGAVSVTNMTRKMFTANPPVKPELDERSYNDRLHQSAVDMAKKMYVQQQKMVDQAKKAQAEDSEAAAEPSPYLNLQDAAYKQAQDRLAKLHDEHLQGREYQEYYGNNDKSHRRSRFSMAAKLRRWSSEGDEFDDRQRSQKIREQMSMFSSKLSRVDQEKREKAREALLAAAQRNVKARLQGMDEKVYQETGRATPAMMSEWEVKAQQAAQARHDSQAESKGKVDIGGGKFMTPEEVDAIASKRVQPVLDDINEKARAERERQAVLKMEEEARREEAEKQKSRDREIKEINRRSKELDKQEERTKKLQEKQEEKARREEEKAAKVEEKRQAKEKRKSKLGAIGVGHGHGHDQDRAGDGDEAVGRDEDAREGSSGGIHSTVETHIESSGAAPHKGSGSTSPTSKVKGWIRNRFSRGKSMSESGEKRRSFFGGAALTKESGPNASAASLENRSTSMRDVAIAGQSGDGSREETGFTYAVGHEEPAEGELERDSRGVSPVSTPLEEERQLGDSPEKEDESAERRKMSIEPPPPIVDPVARTSSSPTRDSRFREMMDR